MKAKEFNQDVVNHVCMYINNISDIYLLTEWLEGCVVKRIKKGLPCTVENLANCKTMYTICQKGVKLATKYDDWCKPTNADKREIRRKHAELILEDANYLANH